MYLLGKFSSSIKTPNFIRYLLKHIKFQLGSALLHPVKSDFNSDHSRGFCKIVHKVSCTFLKYLPFYSFYFSIVFQTLTGRTDGNQFDIHLKNYLLSTERQTKFWQNLKILKNTFIEFSFIWLKNLKFVEWRKSIF